MARRLVLTEYTASPPVELDVDERDELRTLVPDLTIEAAAGLEHAYVLTSGPTVGVVRVGDLLVELLPKVGFAPVLFMASYAIDTRAWKHVDVPMAADASLAEVLITLFARATQQALARGLLHGYRAREDTMSTIRGRVRMADQFRAHAGLPLPVEVAYDDFTPDILENRLLRGALDVLGRLHLRHESSRVLITRLHQQLHGIDSIRPDDGPIPEPLWTRLNAHYRPAVSLARLVLGGAGLAARIGIHESSAFLIDMNKVFEDFVRVALSEALSVSDVEFPAGARGHQLYLDIERRIALRPDLTWWRGNRCVFAGDCKYKKVAGGSVANADLYQMLAYLTALQLDDGLLVYAAGEDGPHIATVCHSGRRLHVQTLDVSRPPHDLLVRIGNLATLVRAVAEPLLAAP